MLSTDPHVSDAFHFISCMWAGLNERGQVWHKCLDVKINIFTCCLSGLLVFLLTSLSVCVFWEDVKTITHYKITFLLLLRSTLHLQFSFAPSISSQKNAWKPSMSVGIFEKSCHEIRHFRPQQSPKHPAKSWRDGLKWSWFLKLWETTNEPVLNIQLFDLYMPSLNRHFIMTDFTDC